MSLTLSVGIVWNSSVKKADLYNKGVSKDLATKQGNRRLQATIYFFAIQMIQVS